MTTVSLTIGDILQELLHRNRLTESELARKIKVPRATINRLVSGRTPDPRISTLEAIAAYFEISVDQLLGKQALEADQQHQTQSATKITQIPILDINQTLDWEQQTKNPNQSNTISSQTGQFAVKVTGEAMWPQFSEGTLLIIDTKKEPKNRDFVLVYIRNDDVVLFRKLLSDSSLRYVEAINKQFPTINLNSRDLIVGVVVESRNVL